ncbi:methyltransferase [Pseudoflavitalea sp. G-6-1-2]|uniref:tRNA1(Val) (adenine(37)-N6)-methyltransferase n=1 Tax=Pseudoflavitalea sp. G-6-1-2 TaxID=2728841 RepID=UPI00146CEF2E|nr:methyltransferase [Pseudoflavitalea sp. G-6-1-2]NML21839.1 methyltransferase [Pseudoflavitalea sp. G-6-1-2]
MANGYFQFKQFTVNQDQCAMKVCTDACIFGAWFAAKTADYTTVLDIGAGTGLLSLMFAQKSNSEIHGIELDLGAYKQLKGNVQGSIWKDRITVFPGDARSYSFPIKYDFIITNPPFFENDLASASEGEQLAKHSKQLTLEELIGVISRNLEPHGAFGILLPYHRWEYFHQLATANGFSLVENLLVKQTPKHDYFRSILHYSRVNDQFNPAFELTIKGADNEYTKEFTELLKDYYLYL